MARKRKKRKTEKPSKKGFFNSFSSKSTNKKKFVTEGMEGYVVLGGNNSFPIECLPKTKESEYRKHKLGRRGLDSSITTEVLSQNILDEMADSYESNRENSRFDINDLEIDDITLDFGDIESSNDGNNSNDEEIAIKEELDVNSIFKEMPEQVSQLEIVEEEREEKKGLLDSIKGLFGARDKTKKKERPKRSTKQREKKERFRKPKPKPKSRPKPKPKPKPVKERQKPKRQLKRNTEPSPREIEHDENEIELNPDLKKMLNSQTYRLNEKIVNKDELVDRGD